MKFDIFLIFKQILNLFIYLSSPKNWLFTRIYQSTHAYRLIGHVLCFLFRLFFLAKKRFLFGCRSHSCMLWIFGLLFKTEWQTMICQINWTIERKREIKKLKSHVYFSGLSLNNTRFFFNTLFMLLFDRACLLYIFFFHFHFCKHVLTLQHVISLLMMNKKAIRVRTEGENECGNEQ